MIACAKSDETPHSSASPLPPQRTATAAPEYTSNMAVIQINTVNNTQITSKEDYINCTVSIENCAAEYRMANNPAGIRIRGNSTATAEKKPYRLRFDEKQIMLGLNDNAKCRNWCLMADYFDPSMMRTATAFRLGRTLLDGKYYASDSQTAEVYINGQYAGVYLICEQTQINKNRINIYEKDENDMRTEVGYLMIGQGGRTDEPNTVQMHANEELTDLNGDSAYCGNMIFSLSGGDYTQEQMTYIENWCSAVYEATYKALYENEFYSVDTNCNLVPKTNFSAGATTARKQQETVDALIDIESAVRMYILDEIVKNLDAATFNMYADLSPAGNHKLTFAAPWDFDFAFANTKYDTTFSPEGIYAANFSYSEGVRTNSWYIMLNKAPWFRERVRVVWNERYNALLSDADLILTFSNQYQKEYARNYKRWDLLGKILLYHQNDNVLNFTTQYDAAVFVHGWLTKRLKWLDTYWNSPEKPKTVLDYTNLNFSNKDDTEAVSGFNCISGEFDGTAYKFTVTDPSDPYFGIQYKKSEQPLSADKYRFFEITCMAPQSNSLKVYTTELFLVAGETKEPTAGKSVSFNFPADGKYHTITVDLSKTDFWSGVIRMIRIDFYSVCAKNDTYYIHSARFV